LFDLESSGIPKRMDMQSVLDSIDTISPFLIIPFHTFLSMNSVRLLTHLNEPTRNIYFNIRIVFLHPFRLDCEKRQLNRFRSDDDSALKSYETTLYLRLAIELRVDFHGCIIGYRFDQLYPLKKL
jgi:hypothetical protein